MFKLAIKINYKKIILAFFLFFVIFNPPIIRKISFTPIVLILSFIYVLFNNKLVSQIMALAPIRKWIKILFVFFLYYFVIIIVGFVRYPTQIDQLVSGYISAIVYNIALIILSLCICVYSIRRSFEDSDLFDCFIWAGVIEAILSILSFVFPTIKILLNQMVVENSTSHTIVATMNNVSSFRNYGLASTLFDSFGLAMSILALIAFSQGLNNKKRISFLFFLMMSFAACINARTSMVLISVGIVVILFVGRRLSVSEMVKRIPPVILLIVGIMCFVQVVNSGSPTALWLRNGIEAIQSILYRGEAKGFFAIILKEISVPKDEFVFTFGSGLLPNQLGYSYMDMGYFQNWWKYGVVGSLMLYSFYCFPLLHWYRKKERNSIVALMILMVLALYLLKLNIFGYGMGTVVVMPIMMYELVLSKSPAIHDREKLVINRFFLYQKY